MTNFEKIKSMNDDEMADCIHKAIRSYCCGYGDCYHCIVDKYFGGCSLDDIELWLEKEAEK